MLSEDEEEDEYSEIIHSPTLQLLNDQHDASPKQIIIEISRETQLQKAIEE